MGGKVICYQLNLTVVTIAEKLISLVSKNVLGNYDTVNTYTKNDEDCQTNHHGVDCKHDDNECFSDFHNFF